MRGPLEGGPVALTRRDMEKRCGSQNRKVRWQGAATHFREEKMKHLRLALGGPRGRAGDLGRDKKKKKKKNGWKLQYGRRPANWKRGRPKGGAAEKTRGLTQLVRAQGQPRRRSRKWSPSGPHSGSQDAGGRGRKNCCAWITSARPGPSAVSGQEDAVRIVPIAIRRSRAGLFGSRPAPNGSGFCSWVTNRCFCRQKGPKAVWQGTGPIFLFDTEEGHDPARHVRSHGEKEKKNTRVSRG